MKKLNLILKEVLDDVEPPKEKVRQIEKSLRDFLSRLKSKIKLERISVDVFVGGSYAKKTLVKKDKYDIDIFLRFEKKHEEKDIPSLAKKILKGEKYDVIHGSRDYYKVEISEDLFFEIVPVRKVKKTEESENITDLSYSHVNYIRRKIKSKKILDDIKIAKSFCYANKCYGAESYIKGFSGYGLELLIYHYGSFAKFIKAMSKKKSSEKSIIDIERQYPNKKRILMDINSAKLESPIILIDPTYKQRNVLAALSEETFANFQKICKNFLQSPSKRYFHLRNLNHERAKERANKKNWDFVLLKAETTKPEGDVAGSKLLKFYNHIKGELNPFFGIKECDFEYEGSNKAKFYFTAKRKNEILKEGPLKSDKKNLKLFKSKNKKTFFKGNRIYASEKIDFHLNVFIKKWMLKNKRKISEMYITKIRIIE